MSKQTVAVTKYYLILEDAEFFNTLSQERTCAAGRRYQLLREVVSCCRSLYSGKSESACCLPIEPPLFVIKATRAHTTPCDKLPHSEVMAYALFWKIRIRVS